MEEVCLATGSLTAPARPATRKLSGRKLAMRIMLGALGASVVLVDLVADHVWKRRKAL